jgi:hypothetical protein
VIKSNFDRLTCRMNLLLVSAGNLPETLDHQGKDYGKSE